MKDAWLTIPQENIWNLYKYYSGTAIANICGAFFSPHKFEDISMVEKAINLVLQNQTGLRLRFEELSDGVQQYVAEYQEESIPVINFDTMDEFHTFANEQAKKPIRLEDGKQYRLYICCAGNKTGILCILSHLIADAWSMSLLINQMWNIYQQLEKGEKVTSIMGDYMEYVEWSQNYRKSEKYEKDFAFWEKMLEAKPEIASVRPESGITERADSGRSTKKLDKETTEKLKELAERTGFTPVVIYEAAVYIYLHRINPSVKRLIIGIPVLNRATQKEKNTCGMFISTMPLMVEVGDEDTIEELLTKITNAHRAVFRHERFPYNDILKMAREKYALEGGLYECMSSYQNATLNENVEGETFWYSNGYSEIPLGIHIDNRNNSDTDSITIDYQTGVFKDDTEISLLWNRMEYIIRQIVDTSGYDRQISDIDILTNEERKLLLESFNDTHVDYPREKCVHELFTEQVQKHPDRIALVFEDKKFTYRQLDEMSNALAHALREKGIGRGDIVPLIAHRSWHVIVAMLGVLKAGGAYMPVSPDYPLERIKTMTEISKSRLALCYGYDEELPIAYIDLDKVDYGGEKQQVDNINHSKDLCYCITTSGSTGIPKIVSQAHGNVVNYSKINLCNIVHNASMDLGCESIISVTNIVFDIFVTESIFPLLNGMTIYFGNDEEVMSQEKLSALIRKNKIDVLQTTPTKMRSFMMDKTNLSYQEKLKVIILGGEAFPEDLYTEIKKFTDANIYNIYGPAETTVWSTNARIYEKEKSVHNLFRLQALKTPDKIAVVFDDRMITYRQLDEMSDSLASELLDKGVQKEDVVGVYLTRTEYVVISQLAVLKAGAVFLPIDNRYPKDRVDYMLSDCKVRIVLADRELNTSCDVKKVDLTSFEFKEKHSVNVKCSPNDAAYVIYTSGSTGKPKGCVLKHKGLFNFCKNNNLISIVSNLEKQVLISVNTISFDYFIAENFLALVNGWKIVLTSEEQSMSREEFKKLVKKSGANILQTTPTRLELYLGEDNKEENYFEQFDVIVSAGEKLNENLYEKIKDNSHAKIYNPLGPSECTVGNTDGDFEYDITIGKPIANTQIYILDEKERMCPIGIAGELCIAGDGVGAGYLNRPELTAEKFVPNPFATIENGHGKIMYKTGDLARWRADGEIEYLGRIDTQIKIRGLRVELGEIESVMASFPGIQLVAATDKKDESGRQYLVGYYTAETEIDEKELREVLRSKLPKYMVPNYFMHIKEMPMTASGKTDRKNLPLPDWSDVKDGQDYVAPITSTEERLAKIWGELLHIQKIGREDDFFEVGGDSLLAISMVREIETQLHKKIRMSDVLENTVLWKLASVIGNEKEPVQEISIPKRNAQRYELTYQQMAIYAECEKDPETLQYNMPAKIKLPADADREKLKYAIRQVYENHGALKTYIENVDGKAYGVIDKNAELVFEMYEKHDTGRFLRPFDLTKAPLFRIGFNEDELLFDAHHIISDGTSLKIILTEIFDIYQGKELMPEIAEYSDYAEYYKHADFGEHKDFFKQMLKCDLEPVTLPETRKAEKTGKTKSYQLGEGSDSAGEVLKKRYHLTDTMLYLGAYAILLSKYSAKTDVLTSMVCTNRLNPDVRRTVGMFVNTLPLHLSVRGEINEYFEQVKKVVMGIYQYQDIPFLEIAEAVGMQDKTVVNTSFIYQAEGVQKLILGEERLAPDVMDTKTSKFDLMMEVIPSESGHTIRFEWRTDKYDEVLIDSLMMAYRKVFTELLKTTIEEIDLVSAEDKEKQLVTFNDTFVGYRKEKCVHELFMEQVQKHPDRIALVFEDKKFTYRQMDEMSNSLAHKLVENEGIGPNDIVPIIAHRSWQVIVAMLGVLKAGGAYMPVSPDFPMERIEYMLDIAKVKCALTYEYEENVNCHRINLGKTDYDVDKSPVVSANTPDDLCYIIFTSGSTGMPKGVSLYHSNVVNYCVDDADNLVCHEMLKRGMESIVSVTNIVFDIFVTESLLPLLNGMTIYFGNDEEVMSQERLSALIKKNQIDVLQTTPTRMRSFMLDNSNLSYLSILKTIILGGEALSREMVNEISQYTDAIIYNIYGPAETTVWSTNARIYEKEKNVHNLFRLQALKTPDKIAVVFDDRMITYRQLDEMSDSLASELLDKGVQKEDVVGVYLTRTEYVVISQLAVLKAGAVFLPIDNRYPKDRVDYMLSDCKVRIVLADRELNTSCDVEKVDLTSFEFKEKHSVNVKCSPNDAAYVIYTSGSTGKPKGCVLKHKGLFNFCMNNNLIPKVSNLEKQILISVNTISFDFFIAESLLALVNGWSVVLASEEQSTSREEFKKLVKKSGANILQTTPTRLELYLGEDNKEENYFEQFDVIVSSGEKLNENLYEKIKDNSHAKIYNPLGPSECTVWNTDGDFEYDITIGKPIANTQIYILDTNQHLLPLGVAGELCIAGDGVGAGYLNRPELTAERFVPNPFATIENGHGKIMYKTGDLARWRADGEIEYLGRIDTQIKIRGLRVELGEIESVMASFPGIQLVAATDKKDESGRQYLVGYYTAETEIDEKKLREVLRSKLPKYMVPNYFMHIKEMPMTASGKTDRKNLPLPEFTSHEEESGYVPPETFLQEQLCDILKKIFGTKRYGLDDDFFDMGGDSLRAIEFTSKSREIGISFPLQSVFDYPTVRALSLYLEGAEGKKVTYAKEDFDKYQELLRKNKMDEQYVPVEKTLGNVLLTGATGFLGAHILDELMKNTSETVYCLVRSGEPDDRRGRMCELLEYYFGDTYEQEIGKRIIPVVGDIEKEGLSEQLPDTIRTVIHAAATVKHYGSYEYFDRVNVQGTKHVVEFAKKCNARLIHISTLSVSGNSFADAFKVYRAEEEVHFDETSLYIDQPLDNVYIHSKFEAEKAVLDAALEGLDVKIIRVGNLTNRASDMKFQRNYESNAFLTRVKAALELGVIPDYLLPLYSEFSPIDLTAKGVVLIARYASADHTVFHLNSNRPLYFDKMIQYLNLIGVPMKVVTAEEFGQKLQESLSDNGRRYIYEAFQNDMDTDGKLVYDTNIRIENDITIRFLEKLGFSWNEIDEKYVKGYIDYFRSIGYIGNAPYPLYDVEEIVDLKDMLLNKKNSIPEKIGISYWKKKNLYEISYSKIVEDVVAMSAYIEHAFTEESQKHIAIIGDNLYEWIVAFFAIACGGNVAVAINKDLPLKEINRCLLKTDCIGVFCTAATREALVDKESIERVKEFSDKILLFEEMDDYIRRGKKYETEIKKFHEKIINPKDPAAIFLTSGTAGVSKCVTLSHKNLVADVMGTSKIFNLSGNTLAVLPFYHTLGFSTSVLAAYHFGKTIYISQGFRYIPLNLQMAKPQTIVVVPMFIETFYKMIKASGKNPKEFFGGNLEYIISGGAALDPIYIKEYRKWGITILNGYGITECSPVVSCNRNQHWRDGSVGQILPICQVKIAEDGEILISGDNVMMGYYKDPEETRKVIQEGWYHTGDLGHIDQDGFLFVTGRKKNLIILQSGENVSPEELEQMILHIKYVKEVIVCEKGGRIVAQIYPDHNALRQDNELEASIQTEIDTLNRSLPPYKRISQIQIRETEFEKTSTNKIKR